MKKSIAIGFVALLLAGCGKKSPATAAAGPVPVTDWGVVEVSPNVPKHLLLDGKDCVLMAEPFLLGKLSVRFETDETLKDSKTGALKREMMSMETTVLSDTEMALFVGRKPVRFTLKLKTP